MLLVSKKVVSNVAIHADQLGKTSALRAARTLPGFEASEQVLMNQTHSEKQARQEAADSSAADGPSGGRLTSDAW